MTDPTSWLRASWYITTAAASSVDPPPKEWVQEAPAIVRCTMAAPAARPLGSNTHHSKIHMHQFASVPGHGRPSLTIFSYQDPMHQFAAAPTASPPALSSTKTPCICSPAHPGSAQFTRASIPNQNSMHLLSANPGVGVGANKGRGCRQTVVRLIARRWRRPDSCGAPFASVRECGESGRLVEGRGFLRPVVRPIALGVVRNSHFD